MNSTSDFHRRLAINLELKQGGDWLRAARSWMQSNVPRGDTLEWSSGEQVTIPFCRLEDLALTAAAAAIHEDRERASRSRWYDVSERSETSAEIAQPIAQKLELGRSIARMYIAAQGLSPAASNAACDAMEGLGHWEKFGFNQEMAKSPYGTRA